MKKLFLLAVIVISALAANAQSPCSYKYGATEADSLEALDQIAIYQSSYKNGQYEKAYIAWQYLVNHCPCANKSIFSYANTMLKKLIEGEQNSAKKAKYIDSLLWSYDNRYVYFPTNYTKGESIGWKAYYTLAYTTGREEEAYNNFITCVELEKENTNPSIWEKYFELAVKKTQTTKDTTHVVNAYERANDYIETSIVNAIAQYEKDTMEINSLEAAYKSGNLPKPQYDKKIKKLLSDTTYQLDLVEGYRIVDNKLEVGFMPYANGNLLLSMYTKKYEENKGDLKELKKMINLMAKDSVCRASELYGEMLLALHKAEPTGKSAYLMGIRNYREKNMSEAYDFFRQATSLYTTSEEKAQPYYYMALIDYSKKSYASARTNALSAARCNPKFGKAYILIGDMYRNSYNQYTKDGPYGGKGVIAGAVYWAAADQYNRARSIDSSVAGECSRKISSLGTVSTTVIFENNLTPGQTYHVGGWINVDTTVR